LPTHRHFEELCALSTSEELSREEANLLAAHLSECDECRAFLRDTRDIASSAIPADNHRLEIKDPPAGLRERFLARAQREGLQIKAGPMLIEPNVSKPQPAPGETHANPVRMLFSDWPSWALLVGTCTACFLVGVLMKSSLEGKWQWFSGSPHVALNPNRQAATSSILPDDTRLVALTAERDRLVQRAEALNAQLEAVKRDEQATESNLEHKLASTESDAAHDHDALTKQTQALTARSADLESQLNTLRQQQSVLEADLRTERARTSEYAARLELAQKAIRAEANTTPTVASGLEPLAPRSDEPSPSEIGSLVAARNLHIIDVYDSNAAGARQRAFGRVFYVEGRSLVFYAFDLTAPRQAKNITFHLWGEKAGQKETSLSLGILHDDDPAERRWALTFDDPKVLARINSVYVTAESKPGDQPRGPKILYAYFGSQPNHP
jgi:hypothetical protein